KNSEVLHNLERISTGKEKVASDSLQRAQLALSRIKQEDRNDYEDLQGDIDIAKNEIAALQSEHHQFFVTSETGPALKPDADQISKLAMDDDSQIAKVREIEDRIESLVNSKPRENASEVPVSELPTQNVPVGSWKL